MTAEQVRITVRIKQNPLITKASNAKERWREPYEMGNTRKPHLTGIQEFGTAAHFKDLTLGKLDARVTKGCFMGYESKSAIVHGDSLARHSLRGRETKPSRPPRKMSTSKNLWQNLKKTNLNRI